MEEKIKILLEVYQTSVKQMERTIENVDTTAGTEFRLSIEKRCYNIFIEQLQSIINEDKL